MTATMRWLRVAAPAVVLAATLGFSASGAVADPPLAASGGATSVTTTSAILNGAVSLSVLAPAAWTFQWGPSSGYGHTTPATPLARKAGLFAVGATITGLKPGTVYHFRLLVGQTDLSPVLATGSDLTFVTTAAPTVHGYAKALTRLLVVHSGAVTVPLSCTGPRGARCSGFASLTVRHEVCAGGAVSLRAGSNGSVKWAVSRSCRSRLLRARKHRVGGTLSGTFTGQHPLRAGVRLALG
jgi:hypothetical protein